jgi:hypothetical protein
MVLNEKAPNTFGALYVLFKHSNDITNPVQRLYATTTVYLFVAVSFYHKYKSKNNIIKFLFRFRV